MDYKIIIPSYQRSQIINLKTLKVLSRAKFLQEKYLFLLLSNRKKLYLKILPKNFILKLLLGEKDFQIKEILLLLILMKGIF